MIEELKSNIKKYADELVVASALIVSLYLSLPIKKIAFLLVLTWVVLRPLSTRQAAQISLIVAAIIPLLILFNQIGLAEQVAIGLYIMLIYLFGSFLISRNR